ncbi:acyltransferase family protein [Phocaeicola sp.]
MNRVLYIDNIKGFAIFLVVLGHLYLRYEPDSIVFTFLSCFHMPVFIFASGFLAKKKENETFISYAIKRTRVIMLPYLAFCLLNIYLDGIHSAYQYLLGFTRGGLWFLPTIWIMNLIHYLVVKNNPSKLIYFGTIIFIQILFVIARYSFSVELSNALVMRHLATFWLIFEMGYVFRWFNLSISEKVAFITTMVFLITWTATLWYIPTNEIFRMIIRFSSTLSMIYFFRNIENSRYNSFFAFLGTETLAIYILHYQFLRMTENGLGNYFSDSAMLRFFLFIATSCYIVIVCIFLKRLLCTNKYISIIFFGELKSFK